jgi:hypothetical protein
MQASYQTVVICDYVGRIVFADGAMDSMPIYDGAAHTGFKMTDESRARNEKLVTSSTKHISGGMNRRVKMLKSQLSG